MNFFIKFVKYIGWELLVIFLLILVINNYLLNEKILIKADGIGYYDYLPSIFIYNDIYRFNQDAKLTHRIADLEMYVKYEDFLVNKYPCGTALFQMPIFLTTLFLHQRNVKTGYERPFHLGVFYTALICLFISLIYIKNLLLLYSIKTHIIGFMQLLIALGSLVLNYVFYDPGFSHIYSLMCISGFFFFLKKYSVQLNSRHLYYSWLFFGLIVLIRPINIVVLLFIPYIVEKVEPEGIFTHIYKNWLLFTKGILLFLGIFSIQFVLWYLQTGSFLIYSYQGEWFNFSKPEIINILFSYKSGLFVYTPLFFLGCLSTLRYIFKKEYTLFIYWLIPFMTLTYIFSSWHSWNYGASFGIRPYLEYSLIFILPLALLLNQFKFKSRILIAAILSLTIPLNIIQTYQYKNYILHWWDMSKQKYWDVFLRTDLRFQDYAWKHLPEMNNYGLIESKNIGDFNLNQNQIRKIHEDKLSVGLREELNLIQIELENDFIPDQTIFIISIKDSLGNSLYWRETPLFHFSKGNLNECCSKGEYFYEFSDLPEDNSINISLFLSTFSKKKFVKNINIAYYHKEKL
jgi:hypothetical protein